MARNVNIKLVTITKIMQFNVSRTVQFLFLFSLTRISQTNKDNYTSISQLDN